MAYIDAPMMVLPRTADAFRGLRKSKYWREQGRSARKFDKEIAPARFSMLTAEADLQRWLPEVHALFLQRWEAGTTRSAWATAEGFQPYQDAMIELAGTGEAALAVLLSDATGSDDGPELLAYGYLLEQDRTAYFYQHAATVREEYRSFSLGTRFLIELLEHCIASERFDAFDFMVGVMPYKLQWATCIQRVYEEIPRDAYDSSLAWRRAVARARATSLIRANPAAMRLARRFLR